MLNAAQRLLQSWWPKKREPSTLKDGSGRGYGRILVEGADRVVYHFANEAARRKFLASGPDAADALATLGLTALVEGKYPIPHDVKVKRVTIRRSILADRTKHHPQKMRDMAKAKGVGGPRKRKPLVAANDDGALEAAS